MHLILAHTSGARKKKKYPVKKLLTMAFVKNEVRLDVSNDLLKRKNRIARVLVDIFGHESEPKNIHLNSNRMR